MTSMEQVFNLFDRFVTAHEQLAKAVALAQLPPAPPRPPEITTEPMPAEATDPLPEAVEASAQNPPEGTPDRAFLKAELDRLGVAYTSKTATTTLLKRYKEALDSLPYVAAEETKETPPPNPPADKLWKIEEVRERLHAFVGRYGEAGRTAAREKLNTLNAVNLSALDPAHFPEMIAFINNYAARG